MTSSPAAAVDVARRRRLTIQNPVMMLWTPRARGEFSHFPIAGRGRVVSTVRGLVRRMSETVDWFDDALPVPDLPGRIYELESDACTRVLVQHVGAELVVVAIGGRGVAAEYAATGAAERRTQLDRRLPISTEFLPGAGVGLFLERDERAEPPVGATATTNWHFRLDDHQGAIVGSIVDAALSSQRPTEVMTVRGGVGAGMAAILLNAALALCDLGIAVRLECPDALADYVQACTGVRMSCLRGPTRPGGVVLIDDPSATAADASFTRAALAGAALVVTATQPLAGGSPRSLFRPMITSRRRVATPA